jgi:hypothetical protein
MMHRFSGPFQYFFPVAVHEDSPKNIVQRALQPVHDGLKSAKGDALLAQVSAIK